MPVCIPVATKMHAYTRSHARTHAHSRYMKGLGVPKNRKYAAQSFARACAYGNPAACINLSLMHAHGVGVKRDKVFASALLDKTCKNGSKDACDLASQLAASTSISL